MLARPPGQRLQQSCCCWQGCGCLAACLAGPALFHVDPPSCHRLQAHKRQSVSIVSMHSQIFNTCGGINKPGSRPSIFKDRCLRNRVERQSASAGSCLQCTPYAHDTLPLRSRHCACSLSKTLTKGIEHSATLGPTSQFPVEEQRLCKKKCRHEKGAWHGHRSNLATSHAESCAGRVRTMHDCLWESLPTRAALP